MFKEGSQQVLVKSISVMKGDLAITSKHCME